MFKEASLGKLWSLDILKVTLQNEITNQLLLESNVWLDKNIDYSHTLAGEIKIGTQCKITLPEWFDIKSLVTKYVTQQYFVKEKNLQNFKLEDSWIVSQYSGDYNPVHAHGSDISGIIYLKIPPQIEKSYNTIGKNGHPCVDGCLQFIYGNYHEPSLQNFGPRAILPEVGDMYIFPGYILHTVYPFKGDGERRSIAFNINFRI